MAEDVREAGAAGTVAWGAAPYYAANCDTPEKAALLGAAGLLGAWFSFLIAIKPSKKSIKNVIQADKIGSAMALAFSVVGGGFLGYTQYDTQQDKIAAEARAKAEKAELAARPRLGPDTRMSVPVSLFACEGHRKGDLVPVDVLPPDQGTGLVPGKYAMVCP